MYQSDVFKDQFEWIHDLIAEFSNCTGITLIIRLHPREYQDKRGGHLAEVGIKWEKILTKLPNNVRIDHPDLKFSISDHFQEVSVFTTGWSTTALEAVEHRIPVVVYDNLLPSFPEQFYTSGNSKNDYFVNLRNELEFPKIRKLNSLLYSCLAYSGLQGTIKLRGGFQQNRVVRFSSLLSRLIRRIYFGQPDLFKWIELRLPVRKSNQSRVFEILQEKGSSSRGG